MLPKPCFLSIPDQRVSRNIDPQRRHLPTASQSCHAPVSRFLRSVLALPAIALTLLVLACSGFGTTDNAPSSSPGAILRWWPAP